MSVSVRFFPERERGWETFESRPLSLLYVNEVEARNWSNEKQNETSGVKNTIVDDLMFIEAAARLYEPRRNRVYFRRVDSFQIPRIYRARYTGKSVAIFPPRIDNDWRLLRSSCRCRNTVRVPIFPFYPLSCFTCLCLKRESRYTGHSTSICVFSRLPMEIETNELEPPRTKSVEFSSVTLKKERERNRKIVKYGGKCTSFCSEKSQKLDL